jgi:hypothetical protein
MSARGGGTPVKSTLWNALNRTATLPKLKIVTAIVTGCGSEEDAQRFASAWRAIQSLNLTPILKVGLEGRDLVRARRLARVTHQRQRQPVPRLHPELQAITVSNIFSRRVKKCYRDVSGAVVR